MKKINIPTKDEIVDYYITQLHTKKESCEYFNVSITTFTRWLMQYNISKDSQIQKETKTKKYSTQEAKKTILQKRRKTCLDKYGVDNVAKSEIVQGKIKQSCLEKYKVPCASMNQEVKQKIKNTNIQKYGYDNYFKTPQFKEEIKKKNITKYGSEFFTQKDIQHFDIWNSKELFTQYLDSLPKKPTVRDLMEFFNVRDTSIGLRARKYGIIDKINFKPDRSRYEDEIVKFLQDLGINNILLNERNVLDGQEIDIYLPDYKFGIEFNGDYWHSDIYHNDHNGRSTYHQDKSLLAESKGVFLFHIFEYEWNNINTKNQILARIKTILSKNTTRIYGRKCTITELDKKQKASFLNENHIQGNDHCTKSYGLLYNGEIVSCMTFIHPKNNKYTWELSRFCNKKGYCVCGGASKLFKYFIAKLNKGDTISSYNDITKTKGDLYKTLGFECISINNPNYVWINFNTYDIRTRYQEQAAGEVARMHSANYHRVCDCGTKTWVYTVK